MRQKIWPPVKGFVVYRVLVQTINKSIIIIIIIKHDLTIHTAREGGGEEERIII